MAEPEQDFPEVAALLQRGPSEVIDVVPPPGLWAAIEAELSAGLSPGGGAEVVSLTAARARRTRRPLLAAAAIAAVALVAVPVGLAVRSSRSSQCPSEQASLSALADFNGTGTAALAQGCSLEIDLSALPPLQGGGYYEAWLLEIQDGKLKDLVPLGDVGGTRDSFKVASSVDLKRYNVVDISREPNDGNPAHSGDSILRGRLQ